MEDGAATTPPKSRFLRYPFSPRAPPSEDESPNLSQAERAGPNSIRSQIKKSYSLLRGSKSSVGQSRANKGERAAKDVVLGQGSLTKLRLLPRASAKLGEALSRLRGMQTRRVKENLEDQLSPDTPSISDQQSNEDDLDDRCPLQYAQEPKDLSPLGYSTSTSLHGSEEDECDGRGIDAHHESHYSLETAPEFFTPRLFTCLPPIEEAKSESFHSLDDLLESDTPLANDPNRLDKDSEATEVQERPAQSGTTDDTPKSSEQDPPQSRGSEGTETAETGMQAGIQWGTCASGAGCPAHPDGDPEQLVGPKAFHVDKGSLLISADPPHPHGDPCASGEDQGTLPIELASQDERVATEASGQGACEEDAKHLDAELNGGTGSEENNTLLVQPGDCTSCSEALHDSDPSETSHEEGNEPTTTTGVLDTLLDKAESGEPHSSSGPDQVTGLRSSTHSQDKKASEDSATIDDKSTQPEARLSISKASTCCFTPPCSSVSRSASMKNLPEERAESREGGHSTGMADDPEDTGNSKLVDSVDTIAAEVWGWMVSGVVSLFDSLLKTEEGHAEQVIG